MLLEEWTRLKSILQSSAEVSVYAAMDHTHSHETLSAVHYQSKSLQMMERFHLTKRYGEEFLRRFRAGCSLLDIAEWIDLSPTTVARRVLELQYQVKRKALASLLKDPTRIQDPRLATEVKLCVDCDEYAGPYVDRARNALGLEYEFRLTEELRNLRVEFETEEDLRGRGCRKTPDVLLRVPVAFYGKVICWVDSKAKFGDGYTLNKDYEDSISSYVGRFGPGMVIYWFGFIKDYPSLMLTDSGVLVVNHFPQQTQMLPGSFRQYPTKPRQFEVTEELSAVTTAEATPNNG